MANVRKVSDTDIRNCYFDLVHEGSYPSVQAIKKRIGGGSNRIQRVVEEIRDEARRLDVPIPIPLKPDAFKSGPVMMPANVAEEIRDTSRSGSEGHEHSRGAQDISAARKTLVDDREEQNLREALAASQAHVRLLKEELERLEQTLEEHRETSVRDLERLREQLNDCQRESQRQLRAQHQHFSAILTSLSRA